MDNLAAAEHLDEIADLIEFSEDEPFKARAYRNAARTLKGLAEPAERLLEEGRLNELPGFGKALAGKLGEFFKGGRIRYLDELRERVPPGLSELRQVPGLGPKKLRLIYTTLGIDSLEKLETATQDESLLSLSGFGAKTVVKLARGIEHVRSFAGQWRYPKAERVGQVVADLLAAHHPGALLEVAGPARRKMEVIDRLVWVIAATPAAASLPEALSAIPECRKCTVETPDQVRLRFTGGVPGVIHFVSPAEFGARVLQETGPESYVAFVRERTQSLGGSEQEQVESAGVPYLPPECRDQSQFWDAGVPDGLLSEKHLRGVLHVHTTYSDGLATLTEMAEAVRQSGLGYLGICDHSQSAAYAGGLTPAQIAEQHEEIDRLNAEYAGEFRIFKGIESDIRIDGSLDYPPDLLATFDFVVASVHSVLDMDEETATERTCRVLANPYTTMLGHSTGRLLLMRKGFPLDWERVIETAARHDVTLELNANPRRLDIDWRLLPRCFDAGVRTAINPDAHRVAGLADMRYGVATARKSGTTPDRVLNCLETAELEAYFRARRP